MAAHYLPFLLVELARLAQNGAVYGDLPQVVKATGPAQPCHVDGREAESLGELLYIVRNSSRMAESRPVALVDQVREGLERPGRLAAQKRETCVRLVHREDERDEHHNGPRVVQGEPRECDAEPRLGRGRVKAVQACVARS